MTDILEHPLVRKYFGDDGLGGLIHCDDPKTFQYKDWIAGNVLRAMQQPICKGDRYIYWTSDNQWHEHIATIELMSFHPFCLRLHQRFQPMEKKECNHSGLKRYCGTEIYCEDCKAGISEWLSKCHLSVPHDGPCKINPPKAVDKCPVCGYRICMGHYQTGQPPKSPNVVEEKIKELSDIYAKYMYYTKSIVVDQLRDLVKLARDGH